jgi:hypothetical protein
MNDNYDTDVDDTYSAIGSCSFDSEELKDLEDKQERNSDKINNLFEDDFLNNSGEEEEDEENENVPGHPKGISNKDYFRDTIKGTFDTTIKKVSEKLLKSTGKEEEMNQFKHLIAGFDNWFLANDTNWVREEHDERYDLGNAKTTFEFVVYDKETNAFTFPFSDVYINVVIKIKGYRPNALRYVADYLRSQLPDSYIQEFLTDEKKNRRKVIFKFLTGNTKFVFMVNYELHLRFHQLLKQYSIVDERFLLMGTFLSFWAYNRGLWKDNYLNPQTLYLMIIYFLMVQNPPILPNIYDKSIGDVKEITKRGPMGTRRHPLIIKIDLNYETDIHKIKAKIPEEKKNPFKIGELITRFFYMFAYEIPVIKRTVSIKKGRLIEPRKRNMNGYSVEDPFFEGYDTCRILNKNSSEAYTTVKKEFIRAYELISNGNIKELCTKYNG